ncbi:MAG: extracellular solute-binding protein [Chloroflexi bacterium]|nr:extracellular solute-binding protein [Chloroflexota bacterium]
MSSGVFAWTRRRVVGATAAIGLGALAACAAPSQRSEDRPKELPARSVPLTLWARSLSDKGVFDHITPLVEQRYPHLAVNVEVASDIFNKLATALAAGTVPDLSVVNRQCGQPFIRKNAFVDLQPYLAKDRKTAEELTHFAPAALGAHTRDKKLYAIPTTNESIVVWYNEDLLRRQNLRPPHEFEDDPQRWTWDTMLDYARKLNRGREQDREVFGLWAGIKNVQTAWGNLVYSNGGRIITDDGAKLTLSEPPAVEAIQWAVDTIWKHDVQPHLATEKAAPNRTLFQQGRLAMLIEGEFFRHYLFGPQTPQGTPFKYNLAQIPFATRTRTRHIVFNALGLPALREGKADAAWQYLTVFVTKDAQQFITDEWGSRGGHKLTYEPWLRSNAGGGQSANYVAIVKADGYGKPQLASPYLWQNELYEPLSRILPQIYNNELPVRTGLQQIDQETNQRLAAAGAPQR